MLNKKLGILVVILLFSGLIFAATVEHAAADQFKVHLNLSADNHLDQMIVADDASIEFFGRTSKEEGSCLPVQIIVDGERETWYPVYSCAKVKANGTWSIRVPAGDEGQPVDVYFNMPE